MRYHACAVNLKVNTRIVVKLIAVQSQPGVRQVRDLFWWSKGDRVPVLDFLLGLEGRDLTRVVALLDSVRAQDLPRHNKEKYNKIHGYENLHELKSHHVRLLFFEEGRRLVFTEAFVKDKRYTEPGYLDRADCRRKEYLRVSVQEERNK